VVGASGRIDGRPVFCYAQDSSFVGGSLGEAHAETILRVLSLAQDARVPVVGFVESAGARMHEATAALAGYGRIFRALVQLSGRVPLISIVNGTSAGGGSYGPALTDLIVMTQRASMFLTGPGVVREVTGEDIGQAELGGYRVQERNGVCHVVVPTDIDAAFMARELLGYLPQNAWESPPRARPEPPITDNPGADVPRETRRVYDVRDVARGIVDGGNLLELAPRWARNIVTAFARVDGRPVGVIANQPRYIGGVLNAEASEKGARFVRLCDAFGLPLVTLVDTPGYLPGRRQEARGVIRHGAKLLHAFAEATVPRVSVILRQAYGGAYITMNAKDLGADFAYAWPRARIGIMGASQAVGIIRRREIENAPDPVALQTELADAYAAEHQDARAAAREGFIDELISPSETRERLCAAIELLAAKRGRAGTCGNVPL
jgi:acetyl-CoA carboxylase carboxyltransferase component